MEISAERSDLTLPASINVLLGDEVAGSTSILAMPPSGLTHSEIQLTRVIRKRAPRMDEGTVTPILQWELRVEIRRVSRLKRSPFVQLIYPRREVPDYASGGSNSSTMTLSGRGELLAQNKEISLLLLFAYMSCSEADVPPPLVPGPDDSEEPANLMAPLLQGDGTLISHDSVPSFRQEVKSEDVQGTDTLDEFPKVRNSEQPAHIAEGFVMVLAEG